MTPFDRRSGAVRLQPLTRHKVASLGDAGRRWESELPAQLQRLAGQWSFGLGRALPGGSAAYVTRVIMADGTEAVLKVGIPGRDLGAEAGALAAADGHGYVRLLAHDPETDAMLLESLGGSLERSGRPPAEQIMITAQVLVDAWRPVTAGETAHAAAPAKARSLAGSIAADWEQQGRPCPAPVVARALAYADRLAADHDPARCVWVHGDPHPGNLLACPPRPGAAEGYVFVDPEPFVDDPAYDLGVLLRDWSGTLAAAADPGGWLAARAAELAEITGVDPEAVLRWAYLERVSTGLYVRSFGAHAVAQPFLDSAARLLGPGGSRA